MDKTIGDLIKEEWSGVDKPVILKVIKQLKERYPVIHHSATDRSEDYICMKDRGERCGGYCCTCMYGVKLR
jgi:hypothetical protein